MNVEGVLGMCRLNGRWVCAFLVRGKLLQCCRWLGRRVRFHFWNHRCANSLRLRRAEENGESETVEHRVFFSQVFQIGFRVELFAGYFLDEVSWVVEVALVVDVFS